jgi:hypothetical protein
MTTLGQWRPTPSDPYPSPATLARGAGYPQFSSQTTWSIPNASYFRPAAPPALTSAQYARDFNETKRMGSQTSTERSSDQTVASWFWATGSASYFWNHIALSLLDSGDKDKDRDDDGGKDRENDKHDKHDNPSTLLRNARLLAALNVAMADAGIGCWDAKYTYNFWRPITAIRELADDGNGATTPDAGWTPLLVTPAHPSYTSGHSCVSSAAATVLAREFGEHAHFTVESDTMLGVTRLFHNFASALEEVKNARIFGGIHFRFDCDFGQSIGTSAAEYVLQHAFQRVH